MADFLASGLRFQKFYTGPDGNLSRHYAELDSNEIGLEAHSGSDRATKAFAADDLIYAAPLPAGTRVDGVTCIITNAAGVGDTFDVGTKQDGAGTWADDDDYFIAAASLAAAGIIGIADGTYQENKPLMVDQPNVYLTVKINNAIAADAQFEMSVLIDYVFVGNL